MASIVEIAVLLSMVAACSSSHDLCTIPSEGHLECALEGLLMPPPGYSPQITRLNLWLNCITELPKNSFSGYPALIYLDLSINQLTEIDFEELAKLSDLSELNICINKIDTFKQPADGKTLEKLKRIDAKVNRISQLDPNSFLSVPNLLELDISFNPLVIEAGQRLLNHHKLEELTMCYVSLKVVDSSLLSGLPNLRRAWMWSAEITSVEGAFINNKLLEVVALQSNAVTQITSGTFAQEGHIRILLLFGNPLKRMHPEALNKAMAAGGVISIRDTPIACDCGFEDLFWWATANGITIDASCNGQSKCSFTKPRKSSPRAQSL